MKSKVSIQYNKIPFVKKDYDSTRIYRNTHKKRVRHRLMTHPHAVILRNVSYFLCFFGFLMLNQFQNLVENLFYG